MANVHPSIPFPPTPVPHAPSPLGFGFGLSKPSSSVSSFGFGSTPVKKTPGWGSLHSQSSFGGGPSPSSASAFGFGGSNLPSPSILTSASQSDQLVYSHISIGSPQINTPFGKRKASHPVPTPPPTLSFGQGSNSRRREREEDEDEDEEMGDSRSFGGRHVKPLKKSRVNAADEEEPKSTQTKQRGSETNTAEDVDLGVLLALLPPASLLPILTSLIQQNPSLKSNVLALLPSPSLPTALEALRIAEQNVMSSIPFGWSKAGGNVSEIYVLGRVKGSVGEVATLIRSHLPFFTTQPTPSHPTTTFSYLSQSTTVLLRLTHLLPGPLEALEVVWPVLANEWLQWVGAVSRLVNDEGGMVSANVAEGWIRELEGLAGDEGQGVGEEAQIRSQLREVGRAWIGQVGWLVGRREGGMRME
ncbi:hypothetical protein [Phaffia rhodozyma]|uniref:Tethering factor for nuclear proteasome STS1 n=1 Tax=Phaffia rhodozyma TaxID=264483 RepID=A0A0F7SXV4_PHARH|nr:hypothetical protein [Phaffia rhodozyma]